MTKSASTATITAGYASDTQLNGNFEAVNAALENTLSLDGSIPNSMSADLDLDSNDIINAGTVSATSLEVAGVTVTDATYVPSWEGPWVTSTAYVVNDMVSEAGSSYICLVAHTSGTFSTDLTASNWELFAQQGSAGAGDMLAASNLSDVANTATSRSNLGLGTLALENTAPIAQGGTGATSASTAFTALKQTATETATGVVEKATTAEAEGGVTGDKFMDDVLTKAAIDTQVPELFTNSRGTAGYTQMPDGTILQWATKTGTGTWTFPLAFPTACVFVGVTSDRAADTSNGADYASSVGLTSAYVRLAAGTARVFAIGY